MPVSNMYVGKMTGAGNAVPINPTTGAVNINAILDGMVSRDIWAYYYTLKIAANTTYAASYSLFNANSGQVDPYAITTGQILSHVETNMPQPANLGFSAPRDLVMDQIGNYFLSGGCGLTNQGIGEFASVSDMLAFCQYSYFEFKIIDKIFAEGFLELQPSGLGFSGTSTQQQVGVWNLGWNNPHAVNRWNNFSKYLAPQMPWSYTIYFPSGSGPAGVAASTLATGSGGRGLWLKAFVKGLTDRAVQ